MNGKRKCDTYINVIYTHTHTHTRTMEYYSVIKKNEILSFSVDGTEGYYVK
jgi:hypothetical protein